MARPTKLTPEVQRRITSALAAGNYKEAACAYGGVSHPTFTRWMNRGEEAKSGMYRDFYDAVQDAIAQSEVRVVAIWQEAIPADWKAARDFLARRFPERWSANKRVQVSGDIGGDIAHTHVFEVSDDPAVIAAGLAFLDACATASGQVQPGGTGDAGEPGEMEEG